MSTEVDIREGVFERLSTADILPVAWPNINEKMNKPYLRIRVLPIPTYAVGIKGINLHQGIVQIDVVVESGVGEIVAAGYVDQVIALFPRNLYLQEEATKIGFIAPGYPGPPLEETEGNGYYIPVSIPYQVLT